MPTIYVNDNGTLKEPERIFVHGNNGTIRQVNYIIINNAGTLATTWSAIYETSRSTTTAFNTTTTYDTTFSTSNSTSNSTTTTFNTTFSTSNSTSAATTTTFTTSFNTSRATTTSFNTSRSTTTSFNTSRTTSYTTVGSYTPYYFHNGINPSLPGSPNSTYVTGLGVNTGPYGYRWNSSQLGSTSSTTLTTGGYQYQKGPYQASVTAGKPATTTYYHSIRRRVYRTTSRTTTFGTSRSTTTTFGTSRSTTTTFSTSNSTSRSTTTTFTTTFNTTNSTSNATTTTYTTTFNTTNSTSNLTQTSRATDTLVYERLTATGAETEVSSANAHNIRYWDGSQWTEE